MKKNLPTLILFLFTTFTLLTAQQNAVPAAGLQGLDEVPRMTMPALDNEVLLAEELERREPGVAPRFAENMEVNISPATHGIWETAVNGNKVWRHRIYSEGAKSLNLGFSKYVMPEGGSLLLYTPKKNNILGPFTPSDNDDHEELWTPILKGDEIVIEVQLPASKQSELQLELKSVNHDYVGFAEMSSSISGSCNLDVICGTADGWEIVEGYRDIIRSVAVISTGGGTFCTGFLVNNVNNDCTPFFMTANHCGINSGNAPSLVTYWNFENSTCRQPNSGASGGNGDGQLNDFNTGAVHRCSWAASDMTLVELDDPVSETANAFLAGWSAEFVMPQDTVIAIHHPSTDEKRISFEFDPTQPGAGLNNTVVDISQADHIIIPDWDIGTTEPGSSGSPVYNNQKQVVGQLHGGGAACGNDLYDSYGWFNTSWEGGGTPATALRFWLDPNDTGITNIAGKDCSFNVAVDPGFQELCAPADAVFTLTVAENFSSDVTLTLNNLPAGATSDISPNPVAPNGTATLTISNTGAVASGQYQLEVYGTDGTDDATTSITVNILEGAPSGLTQLVPADAATGVVTAPLFSWDESPGGANYSIEIAEDAAFTTIVDMSIGFNTPAYNGNFLNTLTTYYWRVKADNICGEGPWSPTWSFSTADIACGSLGSIDVPININSGPPNTVTSTLEVVTTGVITDISVIDLDISHTYVGDLSGTLESPEGTVIQLFNEPGGGGCPQDNLLVSFEDGATNSSDDFTNTCDGGGIAIAGDFQPVDALAGFIDEDPNGTWILTIVDDAGQDGGTINGWDIFLCTTVPIDLSLSPSSSELTNCVMNTFDLDLTIGGAFEETGATLSVTGNPVGSMVTFDNNPGLPGTMVGVTVTGMNTVGTYTHIFNANDGINSTDVEVTLIVEDAPAATNLVLPADAAINVSLTPTLEWNAANSATSYFIELATDAAFTDVVASTNTTLLNFPVPLALEFGTEYFWRANAEGNCGETMSGVNTFTTVPDLLITISPESDIACTSEEAVYEVTVGEGYVAPAMISYTINPSVAVTVSYDVDPNNVMPGSTVTATVSDLFNASQGIYTISFTIADATNSNMVSADLTVNEAPGLSSLTSPANGVDNQPLMPTFTWSAVANADSYLFEIATEEAFTNVVEMQTTTNTSYTLSAPLDNSTTYYWRVSVENECGGSLTASNNFETESGVAVDELEGNAFSVQPNPTNGRVEIVFAQALNKDLTVEVYSTDGKMLQRQAYTDSVTHLPVELGEYTSGVYILRLVTAKAAVARRVTLQR